LFVSLVRLSTMINKINVQLLHSKLGSAVQGRAVVSSVPQRLVWLDRVPQRLIAIVQAIDFMCIPFVECLVKPAI